MEDARSIEMNRNAALAGARADLLKGLQRIDSPARVVVRVLDGDQARAAIVVGRTADRGLDSLPRETAVVGEDRPRQAAGKPREHAHLIHHDVRVGVANDLVTRRGMHGDRNLVAHRARGHEYGRFLADDLGRTLLEGVDRRIFTEYVVTDLGPVHGLAHFRGRLRDRVTAQIDRSHQQFPSATETLTA